MAVKENLQTCPWVEKKFKDRVAGLKTCFMRQKSQILSVSYV